MKKKAFLFVLGMIVCCMGFAQQLPIGVCGIVHTYDAAGNRLKQVYFCNNGTDPYPTGRKATAEVTHEIEYVDALYPNPTTGKFVVTFSKTLNNATVFILDVNGKSISSFKASGNTVNFDLSRYPSGVYFVRIDDAGKSIVKKVVKQD